jgi:hypothetical protein
MPNYVLILRDDNNRITGLSPDQMQAVIQRYIAWRTKVSANRAVSGHKLRDGQGRVISGAAGTTVTDGPYAEAREVIGGLFVIEGKDYDDIVELCRDCPHLDFGTIEIRETEPTTPK